MSFDEARLYDLLPAVYGIRDAEQGEPLRALIGVIAEQVAILEENLDQLYDDQFIETCAEWVVPYIGDLVGARGLDPLPGAPFSLRSQVANTLGYRRRKGAAVVLEQLAKDVTGWNANAVEFFELLVGTQYMNHVRPDSTAFPDVRNWEGLSYLRTPFDRFTRTVDVRRIKSRRGKYNIPNVGLFLWRLQAYSVTDAPAAAATPNDNHRFFFNGLGKDQRLFTRPRTEKVLSQLAGPLDVPMPISRRVMNEHISDYYGPDNSLLLTVNGREIPAGEIHVCDLSDSGLTWGHMPADDIYAVDPERGRMVLAANAPANPDVRVRYYYGFGADVGGGEYARGQTFTPSATIPLRVPNDHATIQQALDQRGGRGVVEGADSGRYLETLHIDVAAGLTLELRAADRKRPIVILNGEMIIDGGDEAEIVLNGLWIAGGPLRITGAVRNVTIRHCTLVPTAAPALVVEAPNAVVEIEKSILGGIRSVAASRIRISGSIVDATDVSGVAYAAPDGIGVGAPMTVVNSTLIGKVHALRLDLASNTIFRAVRTNSDLPPWQAPVWADQRQDGCVRFSYLPPGSITPSRYECPPTDDPTGDHFEPQFTSLAYGDAGYCQLRTDCPAEIRQGADDQSEIGVFHDLYQPQREASLRARLEEYLRFGLEAGIFYAS
jgi:hypothetical protein